MRRIMSGAIATVAAAAITLGTVGLQPAEARHHHHHHGSGFVGAFAAWALIATANEYGNPYYVNGYPYGYPHWNGHRYVYGPGYGGPVYVAPGYWR